MATLKSFVISFLLFIANQLKANDTLHVHASDSLTLAQAYINLSLTENYFDSLSIERIQKILPFEDAELASIKNSAFIQHNILLYNLTHCLLYFNKLKLQFITNKNINRQALLQLKGTLETAVKYFNLAKLTNYLSAPQNPYDLFIGLSDTACQKLKTAIFQLKNKFNEYFNDNIYPDFQRIFYEAKKTGRFNFDSLTYFTALFNLPLNLNILDNTDDKHIISTQSLWDYTIDTSYYLNERLKLIAKYLQLDYLAGNQSNVSIADTGILCESFWNFYDNINYYEKPDSFFQREIDSMQVESLYQKLQKKYLLTEDCNNPRYMATPEPMREASGGIKYYFPIPAPFPSSYLAVKNYKPALKTMKQIDDNFKSIFNKNGYAAHLRYYYVESGFALTTNLEKIDKDGSPVNDKTRWSALTGGNTSSMYETFKSIFFATESNFRIIALIVSPNATTVQRSSSSIGAMQDLIIHSYTSLPKDLENFSLPQKTLTVLIYNYYQSDIGKVPMLDVSKRLPVVNQLQKSGLEELLNDK